MDSSNHRHHLSMIEEKCKSKPVEPQIPSLLWKHGLAMMATRHETYENLIFCSTLHSFSNIRNLTANFQNGEIFALQTEQVISFMDDILPVFEKQQLYFTLIIFTDTAKTIPLQIIFDEMDGKSGYFIQNLLANQYLLYIFCVNFDGLSWNYTLPESKIYRNKIQPIPLGLDFHTPIKTRHYGHRSPPLVHENNIFAMLKELKQYLTGNEKIVKVYLDKSLMNGVNVSNIPDHIQFGSQTDAMLKNHDYSNILDVYNIFDHNRKFYYRSWVYSQIFGIKNYQNIFYLDEKKHDQYQGWIIRSQFAFSLTMIGMGLDCHRTYEALLFDNIVITLHSPLDLLYQMYDFPVVVVKHMNEVNETMLHYWYKKYKNKTYLNNPDLRKKLTSKYWLDLIQGFTDAKLRLISQNFD